MDPIALANTALQKAAEYAGAVQPVLDRHAKNRKLFYKRAHQVAGVLADRGILVPERAAAWADKVASDETGTSVLDFVENLAHRIVAESVAGETKLAEYREVDNYTRALCPDLVR
jgi:hypothetical protein